MSHRGKRPAPRGDDGPVPSKRRKGRPPGNNSLSGAMLGAGGGEDDEDSMWGSSRSLADHLKVSSIYNRTVTEAPAELFRKDLISAMKLPDSEPLAADEYWTITDQWKQEWERGVQVPVNPDSLPGPSVTVVSHRPVHRNNEFKLPKNKYIHISKTESFSPEEFVLSTMPAKAEKAILYDLDDCDVAWLTIYNGERAGMGQQPISETQLEAVIEELEVRCWDKVQTIVKEEEGLGIEFDENVICDVCRSPDSEEGNEMVFCDFCNICVHQACYGIMSIPSGSWLCRTCHLKIQPECVLCPNKGGAMKCTRSGTWAHVSCALWIPEVSIGCVEKMEPITKISSIPQSRWALICVLCRERLGACIQCSVKTCKIAYHVTCAFKHGLEMKAIIEDESADDGVKLRSYCQKHSVTSKRDKCGSASEDDDCKRKRRKDMTSEEKNQARQAKLQEIEAEFEKHVSPKDVAKRHEVDSDGVNFIYNYWVMKRRAGGNRPLLAPKSDDVEILARQQEQADMEKMKNFVQLRQDLERVRNLCYMVERREKLSRSFLKLREQTLLKQVAVLSETKVSLSITELTAIKEANHGPSIYDRMYSHPAAPDLSTDFETMLTRICGMASPTPEDKAKLDLNGFFRNNSKDNPYKRMYFNGVARRQRYPGGMSSNSDSDSKLKEEKESASSMDERPSSKLDFKKDGVKGKKLSKKRESKVTKDPSSSTDDDEPRAWEKLRTSSRKGEKDSRTGSDDSDDLFKSFSKYEHSKISMPIYSDTDTDSESSAKEETSDAHQSMLRTKASVKEFSAADEAKSKKASSKSATNKRVPNNIEDDVTRDKENIKSGKKKKEVSGAASDLIVPQRQAAKKATESIHRSQGRPKLEQSSFDNETARKSPAAEENTTKSKHVRKEALRLKSKSSAKERDGKSNNDIYEFEKEAGDSQEILAYVPQRQAAKKAAEHIKQSHSTVAKPAEAEVEQKSKLKEIESRKDFKKDADLKGKKEVEADKDKDKARKPLKASVEQKGTRVSKSSASSSSSSSSGSGSGSSSSSSGSSSSSSSESEDGGPVSRVSSRESLDKKSKSTAVDKLGKKHEDLPFLNKGKQSVQSSSSSSGSDSESSSLDRSSAPKSKSDFKQQNSNFKRTGSFPKLGVDKKLKRPSDKKLKTSDGRPELESQQPPITREESSGTKDKSRRRRKSSSDRLSDTETRYGDSAGKTSVSRHLSADKTDVSSKYRSRKQSPSRKSPVRKSHSPPRSSPPRKQSPPRKSSPSRTKTPSRKSPGRKESPSSKQDGRKRKSDEIEKVSSDSSSSSSDSEKRSPPEKAKSVFQSSAKTEKIPKKISDSKQISERTSNYKPSESKLHKDDSNVRNTHRKSVDRLSEKREKILNRKSSKAEEEKASSRGSAKYSGRSVTSPIELDNEENISPLRVENHRTSGERDVSHEYRLSNSLSETLDASHKESIANDQIRISKPLPNVKKKYESEQDVETSSDDKHFSKDKNSELNSISNDRNSGIHMNMSSSVSRDESKDKSDLSISLDKSSKDTNTHEEVAMRRTSRTHSSSSYSHHRSIFSPQAASKEVAAADDDLFADFSNDILAVDETVHDDGFSIQRDSEESMRAHPFSFGNELIFKPDSKEDSAQETLNLVEKLRLDYAKKNSSSCDPSETPISSSREPCSPSSSVLSKVVEESVPIEPVIDKTSEAEASQHQLTQESLLMAESSVNTSVPETIPDHVSLMSTGSMTHSSFNSSMHSVGPPSLSPMSAGLPPSSVAPIPPSPLTSAPSPSIPSLTLPSSIAPSSIAQMTPPSAMVSATMASSMAPSIEPPPTAASVASSQLTPSFDPVSNISSLSVPSSHMPPTSVIPNEMPPCSMSGESLINEFAEQSLRSELNDKMDPNFIMPVQENHGMSQYNMDMYSGGFQQPPTQTNMDQTGKMLHENSALPPAEEQWLSSQQYQPSPSPFVDPHLPNKWAESIVMPSRRSSTSSSSSAASSPVPKEDVEPPKDENLLPSSQPSGMMQDFTNYPGLQAYPHCSMPDNVGYHPYAEANSFPGPPMYQPNTSLPYPTSAPYPSNYSTPYSQAHSVTTQENSMILPPQMPAAFTASSHNMAFTAAMVSPIPPVTPQERSETPVSFSEPPASCQSQSQTPSASLPEPMTESPASNSESFSTQPPTPLNPEPSPTPSTKGLSAGKKSPTKPTRVSARVLSQQKSPAKSPGTPSKSPRQVEPPKPVAKAREPKKPKGSGVRGQSRGGRGRGRGRGKSQMYDDNTIHSKLVGTVYEFDFDEESGTESVENLRAMRERRKSTDVHDRKSTDSYHSKDSSQSPKFTSPSYMQNSGKRSTSYSSSVRDLRPPTPVSDEPAVNSTEERPVMQEPKLAPFEDVAPLLPGPVDMRTYNASYNASSNSTINSYHDNLISGFAASATEHVPDIVDEFEKFDEYNLNKTATETETPLNKQISEEAKQEVNDSGNKMLLSDSRNQLKVKIKGPFLDANYVTTNVTAPQQPPLTPLEGGSAVSVPAGSGTSNLRRMRKKELLQQYVTEDMNMVSPPIPPPNRTVITIPKAVASMTSIPTRDDYKAVVAANMEKKKKKDRFSGISFDSEEDDKFNDDKVHPSVSPTPMPTVTPKLKIKIGSEPQSVVIKPEDKKILRVRPPKKRLSTGVPAPSVEELKRDCMQYRKMVMADFEEEEEEEAIVDRKPKQPKKSKEKKKKHRSNVEVIADEKKPKIIIKFKKPDENSNSPREETPNQNKSAKTNKVNAASGINKVKAPKTTPIKLKLSRCEEGYVMKKPCDSLAPTLNDSEPGSNALPFSKDCEVR